MIIHLNSKRGIYEVIHYDENEIFLKTKNKEFSVPYSDFKCFAGGHYNFNLTFEEKYAFLKAMGMLPVVENTFNPNVDEMTDDQMQWEKDMYDQQMREAEEMYPDEVEDHDDYYQGEEYPDYSENVPNGKWIAIKMHKLLTNFAKIILDHKRW